MPANAIILDAPLARDFTALIAGRILTLRDHLFDDGLTFQERGDVGIQIEGWRERLALAPMPERAESAMEESIYWPADIGGEG